MTYKYAQDYSITQDSYLRRFAAKAAEHHAYCGNVNPCFTAFDGPLVVLAQPAVEPQPGEGPLHHPPLLQQDEALGARRPGPHLQRQPAPLQGGDQGLVVVAAVAADAGQTRELL